MNKNEMFRHIQYRSKLRAHCTPRCTAMLTLIRVCVCWYTHTDIHSHYSLLGRFIWIQHNDQLPVSLLAQLVERCTCIVEVMGSNLVRYRIFSGLISTTSSVVFIITRIAFTFVSLTAVHIYDFHIFTVIIRMNILNTRMTYVYVLYNASLPQLCFV